MLDSDRSGATIRDVSRRKRIILIVLVFAAAAVLCVLPSVWPAFMHLISTRVYETAETEYIGFLAGWALRDVWTRCRRRRPETG